MCPIMFNLVERIVLFPTRSPKHEETIWLNPAHIKRTLSVNKKTLIIFSNGSSLLIPARLSSLNTKIQNAEQLESLTSNTNLHIHTFILDTNNRKTKEKQ
ncbi:hypothetical protein GNT69_22975 [Bacillus sp. B15-48]|nr:hypothetical protein [Bacillus sp. B15-48]